jgi:hypothetical protein
MPNPLLVKGPISLLIIAPQEFMAALTPLVQHKKQLGMTAMSVSIPSLVPYFKGVDDPETIKKAIRFAHENLSTKYIMLVGDAHWFPVRFMFYHKLGNQYSGTNPAVFVDCSPAGGDYFASDLYYSNLYHHKGTYPTLTNGAFDNWDANGNGLYNEATWLDTHSLTTSNPDDVDGYPDVAVGRVPAHSDADVTAYVTKIISYENDPTRYQGRRQHFTFVADQQYPTATSLSLGVMNGSGLVGSTNADARFLLIENPPPNPPQPDWTNADPSAVATAATQSTWVSYVGHGGNTVWGLNGVFGVNNVMQTNASKLWPVVFAAGCSTGQFISDLPWNAQYIDVLGNRQSTTGNHGPFSIFPNAQPGVNGPVITDKSTGQIWGVNCAPPGCTPLPAVIPTPNAYDFDRSDGSFAHSWLIDSAPGGAIAYFGEMGVAEDQMGAELETYLLGWYARAQKPVLGDIYLSAQQEYWGNHQTDSGAGADFHSVSRFYLGWMVFFGDPSLRLPTILNLM